MSTQVQWFIELVFENVELGKDNRVVVIATVQANGQYSVIVSPVNDLGKRNYSLAQVSKQAIIEIRADLRNPNGLSEEKTEHFSEHDSLHLTVAEWIDEVSAGKLSKHLLNIAKRRTEGATLSQSERISTEIQQALQDGHSEFKRMMAGLPWYKLDRAVKVINFIMNKIKQHGRFGDEAEEIFEQINGLITELEKVKQLAYQAEKSSFSRETDPTPVSLRAIYTYLLDLLRHLPSAN